MGTLESHSRGTSDLMVIIKKWGYQVSAGGLQQKMTKSMIFYKNHEFHHFFGFPGVSRGGGGGGGGKGGQNP